MKTFLIILLLLAIAAAVVVILIKKGKIKDEDGNFIPDVIEDKVSDIKEKVQKTTQEVKRRTKRVKEELNDIKVAAKNLAHQTVDVLEAVKGQPRKGRKPSTKKTTKSVDHVITNKEVTLSEKQDRKDRLK